MGRTDAAPDPGKASHTGFAMNIVDLLLDKDLITDADKRLGSNGGSDEIKRHPFFKGT